MHRINKKALFIIDGSYLLYRSYYALKPLRTSSGIPTQATYGFCRAIKKLLDDFSPNNLVLAWDSKGKTFRSEIFPEYKATRQEPPSDLFIQKEQILKFVDLINLKQVAKTGYEADDIIYSLVKDVDYDQVIIVGPDKDLYQLLGDKVLVFDPFKNQVIDENDFKKINGFGPEKLSFYYALLGDTSDNIPGVPGVGKKTASEIVCQFDSLDDLYKNLDKVKKDRIRNILEENKESAYLSFKLFSLKHVDLDFKLKDFNFDKDSWSNAFDFFQELEFLSLARDIKKDIEKLPAKKREEAQMSLFGILDKAKSEQAQEDFSAKYKDIFFTITKESDFDDLLDLLKNSLEFAFDTETTGLRPLADGLVGISFAVDNKKAYYIPVAHKIDHQEKQLKLDHVIEHIKPIMENRKIKKILHNAKFDLLVLYHYGISVENVSFDTLLAASLLRTQDSDKINLKYLSMKYLSEPMQTFSDILGSKYKTFDQVPISSAVCYAAADALQTFKLKEKLEKLLSEDKTLQKLFYEVELPLSSVLTSMEAFGIKLDAQHLKEVGKYIDKDLHILESKITAVIEGKYGTINLNSPSQVEDLLFDKLKLPVIKKSEKGQRSTDQEVLEELSKVHPVPGMILKYRELAKLRNTYVDPLINEINPETGRIHTSYSQTMVATGRLSSSNPNLQNIPVSSDYGLQIRQSFIAKHGDIFLSADYSQVELRVLAHLSNDKNLIKAFLHDKDIHQQTASQVFDIEEDKVTHEQRQMGKRINFGIIYGLTPYGLAKDLGIKPAQAKEYIEKYFKTYSGVAEWIEHTLDFAKKHGYVQTWLGRKRYVPGIYEHNKNLYQAASRIATNSPVQGTAAEILKLAMLAIDRDLVKKDLKSKMVLQIHDELVLEIIKDELESVERIVKKEMESVVDWKVPFKVTIRTGHNWKEVSK